MWASADKTRELIKDKEFFSDADLYFASITAKPFFEKRGYIVQKQQSVECRGQFLINYRMKRGKTDVV